MCGKMRKRTVSSVYIFDNGNIAVFDNKGKQIPKLQINILYWIKKQGYNVDCNKINVG